MSQLASSPLRMAPERGSKTKALTRLLYTTDPKKIGKQNLATAFDCFVTGGIMAC